MWILKIILVKFSLQSKEVDLVLDGFNCSLEKRILQLFSQIIIPDPILKEQEKNAF